VSLRLEMGCFIYPMSKIGASIYNFGLTFPPWSLHAQSAFELTSPRCCDESAFFSRAQSSAGQIYQRWPGMVTRALQPCNRTQEAGPIGECRQITKRRRIFPTWSFLFPFFFFSLFQNVEWVSTVREICASGLLQTRATGPGLDAQPNPILAKPSPAFFAPFHLHCRFPGGRVCSPSPTCSTTSSFESPGYEPALSAGHGGPPHHILY